MTDRESNDRSMRVRKRRKNTLCKRGGDPRTVEAQESAVLGETVSSHVVGLLLPRSWNGGKVSTKVVNKILGKLSTYWYGINLKDLSTGLYDLCILDTTLNGDLE